MALSDFDSLQDTEAQTVVPLQPEPTPYERDFLPTQRKYFQELTANPKIGALQAASLMRADTQMAQQAYMQRAAVEQAGMDIKSRQMQFETAKLTLDQAREEAARKRNMFGEAAKLQEELFPVIQDPSKDYAQRKQDLGVLGVKWAGAAAANPAVANALNAANASLTAQPVDRVTKLDYYKAGGDPVLLSEYEAQAGAALGANDEIPIDLFGAGIFKAKQAEKQQEADYLRNKEKIREQKEGLKSILDITLKGELLPDPMSGGFKNALKDSATKPALDIIVGQFGTPEEKQRFQKGTLAEQLDIGKRLAVNVQAGILNPEAQKPTKSIFRSSFTAPSK